MINCQKNLFSIENDIHYLNCAYMAPILKESEKLAIDAIHRQRNPHIFKPHHFFEITQKIRNEFGKLICSSYENIAIMPSTSYGFANAIGVAYDMVKFDFLNELMSKTLKSTKYLEKKL